MSYARFGCDRSDVYVFMHAHGFLECCGCVLQERVWVDKLGSFFGFYMKAVGEKIQTEFHSTKEMVEHLQRHIAAGHHVPDYVIPDLLADDIKNFPAGPGKNTADDPTRGAR
jgi:hypothetical protein